MSGLTLTSLFLAHAGLAALAWAMDKHRRQLAPGANPRRPHSRPIRLFGWAALALSLWSAWFGLGPGVGLTQWFGLLSLAALMLILQLTYLPRSVPWSSLALGFLALIGLAV